jgi:signal transduction histidine kinase
MLARPGVLRPEHAHYAKELRHLAQRSSVFMRGLIDPLAAKADPSLAVPLTDPAAVLRSLSPLLSAIAAPVASVRVTVPTSLPHISIPAESLERILINLVRNAAQAIERSQAEAQALPVTPGTVRIALTAQANNLRLTVDDNGPGMTMIDAAAFLAPSPLLPGARRGLGHRIISELVKASGGTLTVRVRPGRGTRFVILWPAGSPRACTPAVISLTGISEV